GKEPGRHDDVALRPPPRPAPLGAGLRSREVAKLGAVDAHERELAAIAFAPHEHHGAAVRRDVGRPGPRPLGEPSPVTRLDLDDPEIAATGEELLDPSIVVDERLAVRRPGEAR